MSSVKKKIKFFIDLITKRISILKLISIVDKLPISKPVKARILHIPNCREFTKIISGKYLYFTNCNDVLNFSSRLDFFDWERESRRMFEIFSKDAECILDIGAYTGVYSLIASTSNPDVKVLAFEPNPVSVINLRRNIEINQLQDRIVVFPLALGNSNQTTNLNYFGDSSMAFLGDLPKTADSKFTTHVVTQRRLDDIDLPSKISLMKVDIEGSELEFLKGARSTIMRDSPTIFIEALTDQAFIKIEEYLSNLNYVCSGPIGSETGDQRNFIFMHR